MNDFGFYFGLGWEHIISFDALDHILFIAALASIYMLKDWKQVLILITAFTIGHTITLVLSTKEWIQADETLIEFLIPCTIAVTAIFNLFQKSFSRRAIRINYFLALFFGLIHGVAFANILRMVLAREQSFGFSMFSFSVGLESGQILVVLAVLLLCQFFIQFLKVERRHWVIFISAAVFALSLEMAAQRWPWGDKRESETAQVTASRQKIQPFSSLLLTVKNNNRTGNIPVSMIKYDKRNDENNASYSYRNLSFSNGIFAEHTKQSRLQSWQQV